MVSWVNQSPRGTGRLAALRNAEASSCRAFPEPLGMRPSVYSGGRAKCQPETKELSKDLRKIPSHSPTHRELKEKTRPGGGVCRDKTAMSWA